MTTISTKPVLAVEFEGVIGERTAGSGPQFCETQWTPVAASKTLLNRLKDQWYILIHSRLFHPDVDVDAQVRTMRVWLHGWGFPFDGFHVEVGKPEAKVYVETLKDLAEVAVMKDE